LRFLCASFSTRHLQGLFFATIALFLCKRITTECNDNDAVLVYFFHRTWILIRRKTNKERHSVGVAHKRNEARKKSCSNFFFRDEHLFSFLKKKKQGHKKWHDRMVCVECGGQKKTQNQPPVGSGEQQKSKKECSKSKSRLFVFVHAAKRISCKLTKKTHTHKRTDLFEGKVRPSFLPSLQPSQHSLTP